QAVPAVLHHQADRRGDRARPLDQLRHRHPGAWRDDRRRQRTRPIHRVYDHPGAPAAGHGNGERGMSVSILMIDDEPDMADLFRQRFRRETREGTYVLHFALSAQEALDKLATGIEPQLIVVLSDINMPGMDGLALLREIKERRPEVPVMMVTAYGDQERRQRASEYGAAEFI